MSERPTITCKPDGPYLVKNLDALTDALGNRIEGKPVMALCRCGGSANKPFCDGTHQKNGFSGARLSTAGADKRAYTAGNLTIHDQRSLCAHAAHCTDGLATVFKHKSKPWIEPAGDAVEAIIETIGKCPSGALSYTLDGVEGEIASKPPSITVTEDGPYAVVGGVELLAPDDAQSAPSGRYTLCRCGGSKNKPYCDGTHWSIGFKG